MKSIILSNYEKNMYIVHTKVYEDRQREKHRKGFTSKCYCSHHRSMGSQMIFALCNQKKKVHYQKNIQNYEV